MRRDRDDVSLCGRNSDSVSCKVTCKAVSIPKTRSSPTATRPELKLVSESQSASRNHKFPTLISYTGTRDPGRGTCSTFSDAMNAMWGLRRTFMLCLALLLLCCSGWALQCYNCQATTTKCEQNVTCKLPDDSCLKIFNNETKTSIHQCWQMSRCEVNVIHAHFNLNQFNSRCCQTDFCNSGRTSLPITSVVFGLVAAVLLICYP